MRDSALKLRMAFFVQLAHVQQSEKSSCATAL